MVRRELRVAGAGFGAALAAFGGALADLFDRRIPAAVGALYGARGLKLLMNAATAALVLSLPFAAVSAPQDAPTLASAAAPVASLASLASDGAPRAQTQARGITAATRGVVTVAAADPQPIQRRVVERGDTLSGIAESFKVTLDDLAFANGIGDEGTPLRIGAELVVPPGRGALYTVRKGDTVEAVATRFKVDPAVVKTYNRLYFEPQNFAADQRIFIPGAAVPAIQRLTVSRFIAPPGGDRLPARTGRLSWPVQGVITQYFWWGHTALDIAAPYGTPIGASDDGVVVATGWVPVGGLRVCVQHADGFKTCYYHTSAVFVTPGEVVKRGQKIAAIGLTGVTTGPHVHWEVWKDGVQVNGLDY